MKGAFVTGTDTGVGKTVITAAIACALKKRGVHVGAAKPFSSGSWEDTRYIRKAAGMKEPLETITPFYFKYPLAPFASLKLEKRTHRFASLKKALSPITREYDYTVVEGIGGATVPITRHYDALDIARELGFPVLVVARLALGTLNHTLLTLKEIRRRKLRLQGIIFNEIPKHPRGLAEKTNPQIIKELTGERVMGIFPFLSHKRLSSPENLAQILEKHIAVKTLL